MNFTKPLNLSLSDVGNTNTYKGFCVTVQNPEQSLSSKVLIELSPSPELKLLSSRFTSVTIESKVVAAKKLLISKGVYPGCN